VWNYTPRQIQAYLFIAGRRRKAEAAEQLSIGSMAARGDPKAVKKQLQKWRKD
jgi:hypothetical protein